jgi:3-deoxy-D-arabino-heptulosonate 7-phosphate (DAHP) synthase
VGEEMKKKMIAPIVIGILCATNLVYAASDYAKRLAALKQELFSLKQETQ